MSTPIDSTTGDVVQYNRRKTDSNNGATLVEALTALKPFMSKVEDNSIAISSIDNRLALLIEEVRKLSRILYEGNGQPALTARIASLETSLKLVSDSVVDQRREHKETVSKLVAHIQTVDKASSELGIAFDELQLNEKTKSDALNARELANYSLKLNVLQAVAILLITSTLGVVGKELYTHRYTLFPGLKPAPTTTISK